MSMAQPRRRTPEAPVPDSGPVLRIGDLSVEFNGRPALRDVSMSIARGEIHGFVGHNGSGKSTAIKVLAGAVRPSRGFVTVAGRPLALLDPRASLQAGLRFVHQDLRLVDGLDAVDNVALANGYARLGAGPIVWRRVRRRVREMLDAYGFRGALDVAVSRLSPVDRLIVALVRAVGHVTSGVQVVALDEVTAALSQSEVDRLLDATRSLAARGLGVIFVSHYLDEILAISDRVTVLREGAVVIGGMPVRGTAVTSGDLAHLMFGERFLHHVAAVSSERDAMPVDASSKFRFFSVTGTRLSDVTLEVAPGEVVGAYGVEGSGREELAEVLTGASGSAHFAGPDVAARALTLDVARVSGVGVVPRDRMKLGCFPTSPTRENLAMMAPASALSRWHLTRGQERAYARRVLDRVDLGSVELDAPFQSLSGGMQQRALLARALATGPKVLILDEPTQGVDVAARADIYNLIQRACEDDRLAVVVVSSDAQELSEISRRVYVFRSGRVTTVLFGDDVTERNITHVASVEGGEGQPTGGPVPVAGSSAPVTVAGNGRGRLT